MYDEKERNNKGQKCKKQVMTNGMKMEIHINQAGNMIRNRHKEQEDMIDTWNVTKPFVLQRNKRLTLRNKQMIDKLSMEKITNTGMNKNEIVKMNSSTKYLKIATWNIRDINGKGKELIHEFETD